MPSELPQPENPLTAQQEFNQVLSDFDELAGSVLKGHLMIAHQLRALIQKATHSAEDLEQAGLKVPDLVDLAKQHYHRPQLQPVWDMALQLDALRHEMVHRHAPDRVAAQITAFSAPLAKPASMNKQDVLESFHRTLGIVNQTLEKESRVLKKLDDDI